MTADGDSRQSWSKADSEIANGSVNHTSTPRSKATRIHEVPQTGEHLNWVRKHHEDVRHTCGVGTHSNHQQQRVIVDGKNLKPADLIAVATHRVPALITSDPEIRTVIDESVNFLKQHLDEGNTIYGINTGYGGSADVRTRNYQDLQRGLIQHHNSAVLLTQDVQTRQDQLLLKSHALPRDVVRGSMLTRCNSLMRAHSAVRLSVVESLATLLNLDFIPIVPLRGSISASGDLTPLSYIAGALEGNPDIYLDCAEGNGPRVVLPADEALHKAGLAPITMDPKEGLGLMNGTAVSCAAATLALHEAQYLAVATQTLTAMCSEALRGSADNFHSFISQARPHVGQTEVAANIFKQLRRSQLVVGKDASTAGLYQDRYALRTAPQWIGPQLEDLNLAAKQLEIELNSTTDNPLIDALHGHVHHGGNFQAVSVTSAMEKTRSALQMLGKLMFAQCSELINPMLNAHGTPNLCFDEPSVSFTFKGVDINMAAYMSELAFLANPVSSHVQSAEMHNQAVNSLALISTRYTMDAVEIVSLMTATYLYTLCQALDLHVMHLEYMEQIEQRGEGGFRLLFGTLLSQETVADVWAEVSSVIRSSIIVNKSKDTPQRAQAAAEATIVPLTKVLLGSQPTRDSPSALELITEWTKDCAKVIETAFYDTRLRFTDPGRGPSTLQYLGHGAAVMYKFVRQELGVALHKGLIEHPTQPETECEGVTVVKEGRKTIGSRISVIYEALRDGRMHDTLMESME